jgi:hypothetical protein
MTDDHFVSSWRRQASIERVWDEIFHTERWPSWWRHVHRVEELDPGDANGLGRRQAPVFTTRPPYRLGLDIRVRHPSPPPWRPSPPGELDGVGRWTLTPVDGGTLVRCDWDVRTTRWWMNLAAPVARPAFVWNHDALMREAAQSLAHRLDADLELLSSESRAGRPARTFVWACLLLVLPALIVARWRRRTRPQPTRTEESITRSAPLGAAAPTPRGEPSEGDRPELRCSGCHHLLQSDVPGLLDSC